MRVSWLPDEERPSFKGAQVLDARDCIIMPGLVNAHGHTAMTLFRGLADDLPLKQWLFEKIFPAEAKHLSEETVYWGALLGCLEMIASGTTTVSDGYFYQDATARAFQKAGLRALIAQGVIDFPAPGVPDPTQNLVVGKDVHRAMGARIRADQTRPFLSQSHHMLRQDSAGGHGTLSGVLVASPDSPL